LSCCAFPSLSIKINHRLNDTPEFEQIGALFRPLFHTSLLIWKTSKTFNTNARLVCLVRECCNALIRAALNFVNGEKIFEAIEANVQVCHVCLF
jgi:dynein heavy chain